MTPVTNRLGTKLGHWDTMDEGPTPEPWAYVGGHKVYRKDSCTLDHRPVPARRYFGLWQCACCGGIIAPALRRLRVLKLQAFRVDPNHTNGHDTNGRAA